MKIPILSDDIIHPLDLTFSAPHTACEGPKPIHIGSFPDGSGYAVNLASPRGVFYLEPLALQELNKLVTHNGNPPKPATIGSQEERARKLFDEILHPRSLSAEPKQRLMSVWLHISNSCNLACSYCYIPELRKAVEIPAIESVASFDILDAIAESLVLLCVERKFEKIFIRFAGGEPGLVPELIRFACERFVRIFNDENIDVIFGVNTNGTLVSSELLRTMIKYNFSVSISLDGGQYHHDQQRFMVERGPVISRVGTWVLIVENIDKIIDVGLNPFILTTLTRTNYSALDEMVDFCLSRKIGFRLSPVRDHYTPRVPDIQKDILQVLVALYERLARCMPIYRPIEKFAYFAEWNPRFGKSVACGTCKNSIAISERGEVSTCQMRLERSYGNVKFQSLPLIFEDMVSANENSRFARLSPENSGCSSCLWQFLCAGGCPEHTMSFHGTYDRPSPWCQLYGDFLPHYLRSIALQMKIAIDSLNKK